MLQRSAHSYKHGCYTCGLMTAAASGWIVLIYRVPSESSNARVAVWRDLKRLGGLYLQQAACVLPRMGGVPDAVGKIRTKIEELGGTSTWFEVDTLPDGQDQELVTRFQGLAAKEYAEIIEECETKFAKEIEFERFRENFTFEEAEEIRQDLEKIKRWTSKVESRDWFGGAGREDALAKIAWCEELLEGFEEDVFQRTDGADHATEPVTP
jgi:hypothetical protein